MTTISLEGLASGGSGETRALAYIKVNYNGQNYDWQIFIPENTPLEDFFVSATPLIEAQINAKEAAWEALDPKTRTIENPMTGEITVIPILKEEIVCADIPDYYALRRNEYPPLGDQLGAIWKGPNSPDYISMQEKIQAVKDKYPKP